MLKLSVETLAGTPYASVPRRLYPIDVTVQLGDVTQTVRFVLNVTNHAPVYTGVDTFLQKVGTFGISLKDRFRCVVGARACNSGVPKF